MKQKIFFEISAAAALLLLAGCSEENPWAGPAGEGGIDLLFHASGDVETAAPKLRSGESRTIWVPEDSQFSVKLEKTDKTYSKTWASLDDFKKETSFKVGSYKLSVFYGTPEDQGYEMPYFYGEHDVVVEDGETTSVALSASLANTAVIVEYSEAFKTYFSSYKTILKTEGSNKEVEITDKTDVNGNMQEAYVTPGIVDVAISVTKPNGQGTTLSPAKLEVEAGHIYKVRYDVNNGEVGTATLTVEFDDSTQGEIVEIDLSEALFTTGDPVVTVEGYEDATENPSFETLASTPFDKKIKFNVVAPGTFSEAILTVTKDGDGNYQPLFGSPVNLCEANEDTRKKLAEAGIKAVGFFNGKDEVQLASLDMTGFTKSLTKDGKYTIALEVKDKFTRTSGNIAIELTVVPMTMEAVGEDMVFGSGVGVIHVTYNGMAENTMTIANSPFRFEAPNEAGIFRPCTISSIEEVTSRSSFVDKEYIYRLALPETAESKSIPVRMYYLDGEKPVKDMTLGIKDAPYTIETDAFAKRVVIRATESAGFVGTRPSISKYRINGQEVDESRISKDDNGLVTITGLDPNKNYTLTVLSSENKYVATVANFKTEVMADVPNGDFEDLKKTIENKTYEQGGKYTRTMISSSMQNHQTIDVSEPIGWASVNAKTCNFSANPCNSWFVIPSTFNSGIGWTSTVATQGGMGGQTSTPDRYNRNKNIAQNGNNAMVLQNVAWDNNGTLPGTDKKTAVPSGYYSGKVPNIKYRAAGKLFLGSYSYTAPDNEIYNEGVNFSSRPLALHGYYKYENDSQDSQEKGYVEVVIMSGDKVIAKGIKELASATEYTEFSVDLNYNSENLFNKPTTLKIMISSSNHLGTISEETSLVKTTNEASLYLQESHGAKLTIDNLTFEY